MYLQIASVRTKLFSRSQSKMVKVRSYSKTFYRNGVRPLACRAASFVIRRIKWLLRNLADIKCDTMEGYALFSRFERKLNQKQAFLVSLSEIARKHPFVQNIMDSKEAGSLCFACFGGKKKRNLSSPTTRLCQKYRNLLVYYVLHHQSCVRSIK